MAARLPVATYAAPPSESNSGKLCCILLFLAVVVSVGAFVLFWFVIRDPSPDPVSTTTEAPYVFNNSAICGIPNIAKRIIGGEDTDPNEFPWQAALYQWTNTGKVLCGGTLIDKDWILTAAHCLHNDQKSYYTVDFLRTNKIGILLGESDLSQTSVLGQKFEILNYTIHPKYSVKSAYDHDFALIKLNTSAKFSNYVKKVCLPQDNYDTPDNQRVIASGWGLTVLPGTYSKKLQKISLNTVNLGECLKKAGDFNIDVSQDMMCASATGKSTCTGDSGGPLIEFDNGVYKIVGVVSNGRSCSTKEVPAIFSKVSRVVAWIRETMNKP